MSKMIVVIFAAILGYIGFFGGIACLLLPIGSFRSPEEKTEATLLPMSDAEPGLYLRYHPTISFRHGQFQLQESGYFFTGPYTCLPGRVMASHANDAARSVGYTPLPGVLVWDGKWYFNMAQSSLFLTVLFLGTLVLLSGTRK